MGAEVNKQEVPRRVTSPKLSIDKHAETATILLLTEFNNKLDLTSGKKASENHPKLFLVITKKCILPTVADSLCTNKRGWWSFYQKIQMLLNKQGG